MPMLTGRIVKLKTSSSLVVTLRDAYTGGQPRIDRETKVYLEGVPAKPVAKPGGCFIFPVLPRGDYRLVIKTLFYLEKELTVSLDGAGSDYVVRSVSLYPRFNYPYSNGATLVRAALLTSGGKPLPGVKVRGTVISPECAIARLAQDNTGQGITKICLSRNGVMTPGDIYGLRGVAADEVKEYCSILALPGHDKYFTLAEPLQNEYKRGAMFMPVAITSSDEVGEVVLFFRNNRVTTFKALLEFIVQQKNILVREVDLQEGEMTNLGVIDEVKVVGGINSPNNDFF